MPTAEESKRHMRNRPGRVLSLALLLALATGLMGQAVELPRTEEERNKLSGREITILRRQMKAREDEGEAAYKNAETAFLVGEYDKAIEEYLAVSREYEDTSYRMKAVMRVGDVYYRQKKYERAVSYYQRALRVPSELWWPEESAEDYARASYMIGVCYFDQAALNQAFAHFRRFVQKYPDSKLVDRAYDFIGRGNMGMKRYGQAIEAFRMVGTSRLDKEARRTIAPGEELYVRVNDADVGLATKGHALSVRLTTTAGDEEILRLAPLGLGSPVFLGTIKTRLGAPRLTQALEDAYPITSQRAFGDWLSNAETMETSAKSLEEELAALPEPEPVTEETPEADRKAAQELQVKRERLRIETENLKQAATGLRTRTYGELDASFGRLEALLTAWNIADPEPPEPDDDSPGEAADSDGSAAGEDEKKPAGDQLSDVFTPQQIAETREQIAAQPTTARNFRFRRAVLDYWHGQMLQEFKTLDVNGADTVTVAYLDDHGSDEDNIAREDTLTIASDATVTCVSPDYSSIVKAVILGDEVRVRVVDLDMDREPGPDTLEAVVTSIEKVPPKEVDLTAEQEAAEGEDGDEEKEDEQSVNLFDEEEEEEVMPPLVPEGAPSMPLILTETGDHTGVFVGSFPTVPSKQDGPLAALKLSADRLVRLAYRDERSVSHNTEWVVPYEVGIVLGAEGEHEVIEMQESKLDRRSELEKGVALGKLARVYQELGLKVEAQRTFDEALKVVRRVVNVERETPLGEEATYQLWDLYFASGNEEAAAEACSKLIAAFPRSPLADDALLIMGKAEKKDPRRAASHLTRLVSQYPDSPLAPEAQYLVADLKSKAGTVDVAAYEACANKFPESNFAALSLLALSEYYMEQRDYARAMEYLERITLDFPDFDKLDKATFMRGICAYRTGDVQLAYTLMHETIERYPGTAPADSAAKVVKLLAKKLKQQQ